MSWDLQNLTAKPKFAVRITGAIRPGSAKNVTAVIPGRGSFDIHGAFRSWQSTVDIEVIWHREEDLSDEPLTWPGRLVD